MKWKRILSVILAICLLWPAGTISGFAQDNMQKDAETISILSNGDLTVLLRMNYPVLYKENDISATLMKDGEQFIDKIPLNTAESYVTSASDGNSYSIAVKLADKDGNPAQAGKEYSFAELTAKQLPAGNYNVQFTGENFKTFTSKDIELLNYSKRLIMANNNATFTSGDIDGDGKVTEEDLNLLKSKLLTADNTADLNRDGTWDIIDYAYLYNNLDAAGEEIEENTSLIPGSFIEKNILDEEQLKLFDRSSSDEPAIFTNNSQIVSEEHPVLIEIPFSKNIPELQYITLYVPDTNTAAKKGSILYETEDGTVTEVPFGETAVKASLLSAGADTFAASDLRRSITIDLGKRVAVKKITIKITGTESDSKLASIAEVEFLQNLIPTIQDEANTIKNVTAKAGDKSVTLNWSTVSNVTGYKISYGTQSGVYTKELVVDTNTAKIEGLSNDTTYYFIVQGINGDWSGIPSDEISCIPKDATPPGRVGGLAVEELDSALNLTWGTLKNTDSYNVFYKEENSSEDYKKITGIKENNYTLDGLTNQTSYLVCVSATNEFGEGDKSPLVRGTPILIEVKEPEGIPTYNLLSNDAITSIKLSHPDHYDKQIYPNGFDPKTVIDRDYRTHWTARGNWWENQGFTVTFDKAYDMNHLVWVTRLDQKKYKNTVNRYYIEVWGDRDDLSKQGKILIPVGTYIQKNPLSSEGVEILTFDRSSVKQIKVTTKMSDGGPANPSASELKFYTYYSLVDEVSALFQDDLHTRLADGVTLEQISALRKRISGETGEFYVDKSILAIELDVAESLLPGNAAIQNIITAETGRNASKDSSRNFSYTLNDTQPIGITAKAGESLIIYVQTDDGSLPSLVMTQYAGEASAWSSQINLKPGRNIVTVPVIGSGIYEKGGSLYIKYYGTSKQVKLNVIGGKKMPMLNLPDFTFETAPNETAAKEAIQNYITEVQAYQPKIANKNTLETSVENSTEIATKHVLLSIPVKAVSEVLTKYATMEEKTDALYQNLLAWEKNMKVHYTVSGLSSKATDEKDSLPCSRINIRYMTMTGKAFMYAGGAHIGIMYGSGKEAVSGTLPQTGKAGLFGWGLNHEIGHVLDQGGLTYPETTNNIHSLFSQTYDGVNNTGTSRLEGGIYDSVYDKVAVSTPGKANNVFVQLAMYWQLHLAYDEKGEGSFTFYNRLYQLLREKSITDADKDMLFVKLASETAQKDLTSFFEHWGFTLTDETKDFMKKYPKETRAIYYLTDDARRYRVNGKGNGFGTYSGSNSLTVTASQKSNTENTAQIQYSLPTDILKDAVLGYEIIRNGKTIAFTTEESYTDTSITANNIELTYEVIAYDKLLNTITKTAAPFKIIYDGTLDNTNWSYAVTGSAISINMQENKDIAGIKVKEPVNTAPVISGSALISDTWVPVSLSYAGRTDSDTASIYYFNHPDALTNDGRIWTYGVQSFTIELDSLLGLSDSQLKDTITALSYPGDDISFYHPEEENTIGILSHDYKYGDSSEDVIKAGSIIVIGTYRGDPVYNAIKLYGTYSSDPAEGSKEDSLIFDPNLIAGEQYFFAEVPGDKVMTNISNGIWIYVPDFNEGSKLPDTLKAELYRVDNPDTLENERLVSNTIPITVPTYDTLPEITLTSSKMLHGGIQK